VLSVPFFRLSIRFRADSSSCHQLSSHQKQVAEGEQRKELGPVLGKAAVAGLHMAKLAFNDTEGMLNPGPHLGNDAVGAVLKWMQVTALWGLAHDAPKPARAIERGFALGAHISLCPLPGRAFSKEMSREGAQTEVSLPCSSASQT